MTHIDLFSGIGGFTLAAQWAGLKTEVFCEKDERCRQFLERAWPGIPIIEDVKELLKLCEEFVHIVKNERFLKISPDVNHAIQLMLMNGEKGIPKNEKEKIENTTEEEKEELSNIMVENVPAVGKIKLSSFVSIINTIMEMRSGKNITIHLSGKSQLKEDFQMIMRSFAITATTESRFMGYVHIERPTILTAGVPCQPASRAGKQGGQTDDRWLWKETITLVKYFNPRWCLFENPPGIHDVGIDGILSDLEGCGYETGIVEIPACAVNSPQIRQRVWILAHRDSSGLGQLRGAVTDEKEHPPVECSSQVNLAHRDKGRSENGQCVRPDVPGGPGERRNSSNNGAAVEKCGQGDMADTDEGGRKEIIRSRRLSISSKWEKMGHPAECNRGMWSEFVWTPCADGKLRRTPDDSFGLVDGIFPELPPELGEEKATWPTPQRADDNCSRRSKESMQRWFDREKRSQMLTATYFGSVGDSGYTPFHSHAEPLHRSVLAALGNSIVPQVAFQIIQAIVRVDNESE